MSCRSTIDQRLFEKQSRIRGQHCYLWITIDSLYNINFSMCWPILATRATQTLSSTFSPRSHPAACGLLTTSVDALMTTLIPQHVCSAPWHMMSPNFAPCQLMSHSLPGLYACALHGTTHTVSTTSLSTMQTKRTQRFLTR